MKVSKDYGKIFFFLSAQWQVIDVIYDTRHCKYVSAVNLTASTINNLDSHHFWELLLLTLQQEESSNYLTDH